MTHETLYADGGVVARNPSDYGGVFAWRLVADHRVLEEGRGLLVPFSLDSSLIEAARRLSAALVVRKLEVIEFEGPGDSRQVSNNHAELMAVVHGLEQRPRGWNGRVVTDSNVTISRMTGSSLLNPQNIPLWLIDRIVRVTLAVGQVEYSHVKGHPTRADLRRGERPDGQPVSMHQHWCDRECVKLCEWYAAKIREVQRAERRTVGMADDSFLRGSNVAQTPLLDIG